MFSTVILGCGERGTSSWNGNKRKLVGDKKRLEEAENCRKWCLMIGKEYKILNEKDRNWSMIQGKQMRLS